MLEGCPRHFGGIPHHHVEDLPYALCLMQVTSVGSMADRMQPDRFNRTTRNWRGAIGRKRATDVCDKESRYV